MKFRSLVVPGAVVLLALSAAMWALADSVDLDFSYIQLDDPAIRYDAPTTDDPIARLQQKLDKGETKLEYDPNRLGYLPSLLKHLGINVDSQLLVFSKSSFQGPEISPRTPRALYFADDVAIGSVQNGDVIEFVSLDPKQGAIFYTLGVAKSENPGFVRRDSACMSCHLLAGTLNVPGLLTSSVITSGNGSLRFPGKGLLVDGRTPIDERWGGWYVTGTSGFQHVGNAVAPNPDQPSALDLRGSQNLLSLAGRFDTSTYLTSTSDIVALMTLEHQTRMTNLITRLGWETRIAVQDRKLTQARGRLDALVEQMTTYMLFADEASLGEGIKGVSTFTESFPKRGPRDRQGRSLRDFDLHKRLFRYPLSYMIYSEAFDAMPGIAKDWVYQRLYDVLSGKDTSQKFVRLTAEDRVAVLDILRDTKTSLPAYWKPAPDGKITSEPACCN
ncbi:MAG: hypothetical protein ABI833_11450 [Acidobacteriota bacterium]